jgi:Immune inhibitor A-like, MAM domain/Fungalysin metallopeptidase (M36)/Fungalysin/Thermolysin Propeptide Motif
MSGTSRSLRVVRGLLIVALVLLCLLATAPRAIQAQSGCAVAKFAAAGGGAPRWLEDCGRVDPKGNPEAVARRVLAARSAALGLRPDSSDLKLLAVSPTAAATHVRFAQLHKGVPVYLGQVLVQYGKSGDVQLINNHTLPNLNLDVTPVVGGAAAQAAALARAPGSDRLRAPIGQQLVIYGAGKAPVLAWHVTLFTRAPMGDWHVMISATSGAVLGTWNEIMHDTGSGLVYDPNAVQQSGNTSLVDNNDATSTALDNARVTRTLTDLDASNKLKGSYVDTTGPGVQGCTLPYTPGLAQENSRTYNYNRGDDRFEEVNVYAAITGVQNWFQSLGFTNVNNRSIPVNVHCIADDNSNYSPVDRALHFGDGGVDDAEDSDIVIHEYGHSVQDNQVPGWGPGSGTEQRAMGEGFGDFLAGMYSIEKGNATFLNTYKYCIGEWDATFYNPVTAGNSGSGCLRWINGRNEATGADIGVYSGTPTEVHNDGRFWSAALTCIYEGMGANTAARDKVMKLVLQHHFSLTPDASNQAFEDAVDALRLADLNLFGGADQTLIVNCAVARGLTTQPRLFAPTITAPTEGATIAPGSPTTITWNANGAPPAATYRIEYAACNTTTVFSDTVESGIAGWTTSHISSTLDWTQVTTSAHSPTHSWFAPDEEASSEQYLVSPAIPITSSEELAFWHRYDLESSYDGGVVEVSANGGGSWSDLGSRMTSNAYNSTIDNGFDSPIRGRQAFSGDSGGWIETRADLSNFVGQTIRLRFREADDSAVKETGWWVDDIQVATQPSWTLAVTTTAGADSFNWTTPATPGRYCLRIRAHAPDYLDSPYSATRTFIVDSLPAIAAIPDRTVIQGTSASFTLAVSDVETLAANLTLTASSSNHTLLPVSGIVFSGGGASRTVTITPAVGQVGMATITVTVSDGLASASRSFVLTVVPRPKIYLPVVRRP